MVFIQIIPALAIDPQTRETRVSDPFSSLLSLLVNTARNEESKTKFIQVYLNSGLPCSLLSSCLLTEFMMKQPEDKDWYFHTIFNDVFWALGDLQNGIIESELGCLQDRMKDEGRSEADYEMFERLVYDHFYGEKGVNLYSMVSSEITYAMVEAAARTDDIHLFMHNMDLLGEKIYDEMYNSASMLVADKIRGIYAGTYGKAYDATEIKRRVGYGKGWFGQSRKHSFVRRYA